MGTDQHIPGWGHYVWRNVALQRRVHSCGGHHFHGRYSDGTVDVGADSADLALAYDCGRTHISVDILIDTNSCAAIF